MSSGWCSSGTRANFRRSGPVARSSTSFESFELENVETLFPRCGPGYAELTIPQRQQGEARADVLLASHFSGRPLDPGADAVLDEGEEGMDGHLRLVRWNHPQELQEKLVAELVEALGLAGPDDELGFEESLGGRASRGHPVGLLLEPVRRQPGSRRAGGSLADALARARRARGGGRAEPRAPDAVSGEGARACRDGGLGPQGAASRRPADAPLRRQGHQRHQPAPARRLAEAPLGRAYLANGDIGIVVGQYKTKKLKGLPRKLDGSSSPGN